MKISKFNSILLCLNAVVLAAGAYILWQQRTTNSRLAGRAVPSAPPEVEQAPSVATSNLTASEVITVTNEFSWRQLESEDYRAYIQRLRSIRCPEQTIRDIVIADLDKLMAPRIQSVYGRRPDLQFWHSEEEELANERDHREISRAKRDLDQEKRAVIEELLGVDLVRERMRLLGEQDYYERRLNFLPETRRTEARRILEKFDDLEQRIRDKEWHEAEPLGAVDRAELRQLRQQRQAELSALLNPAEREQYELWMSDTANSVRRATYGMDIAREEFLAIYHARKTFDDQWSSRDPDFMDEPSRQRMEFARLQMEADLQRQLGAERFAEYQRGEDPEFHQLTRTATQFKLPKDTAKRVYEMKRALDHVRSSVHENTALAPGQKTAALRAMQDESERAIRQLLGEKAFRYYLRVGDPAWLNLTAGNNEAQLQ